MKISIVTISFNQEKYIKKCIDSVLNQGYKDFEYIIIDAGSIDGSRDIINTYEDSRIITVFEPDLGPADGLNKGKRLATGDIFCYLNSDDVFELNAFSNVVEFFNENSSVDILLATAYQRDAEDSVVRLLRSSKKWSLFKYSMGMCVAVQQATFFRRSETFECIEFNVNNRSNWDGEFLVDSAISGMKIETRDILTSSFRVYEGSITGSQLNLKGYRNNVKRIRDKILDNSPWYVFVFSISFGMILNLFRKLKTNP